MYITNKNPCVDAADESPLQNEAVVMELAPQIDNFFETLTVYADKDTTEEELAFLENSIYDAALFLEDFTDKFDIFPLYKNLRIFYRPVCYSSNDGAIILKGGYTSPSGFVVIRPPYENCDYTSRSGYDPSLGYYITSTLVHEILHTYFAVRFHADPAALLEEGLTSYAQRMLASDFGGYRHIEKEEPLLITSQQLTEDFPDKPVKPVLNVEISEGVQLEEGDSNGTVHKIEISHVIDHSPEGGKDVILMSFDGVDGGPLRTGSCFISKESQLSVCVSEKDDQHRLLAFPLDAEIERTVTGLPPFFDDITPTGLIYGPVKYIYGEDGFGQQQVFLRLLGPIHELHYQFDQSMQGNLPPSTYDAAFLLHTALEQKYWDRHAGDPDFHPDDYFKRLGEMHAEYVEYLWTSPDIMEGKNKYQLGLTTVYREMCEALDLPEDECLEVFKGFGLDVDYHSNNMAKNYCIPSDIEEPDAAGDYLPENEFEDDGGCSFATTRPNFWNAVAEEYRYLWGWLSR